MADLENLLLEAAGRTRGKSGKNRHSRPQPSRRRREGSYSDDGSDSKDSDEDRGYTKRKKLPGSQVPLKKRLDPIEKDHDHGPRGGDDDSDRNNDSGDDDSDVGSDLYKDDDDREQLARLTELEREMILSDRAQKKDDKKLQKQFRLQRGNEKKIQSRNNKTPPATLSRGVRSSARSADRSAAKDDALNELRAKRLKQQDPEAHRKLRDSSSKGRPGTGGRGSSPVKRKPFTAAASLSSSSQSDSESGSQSEDEGSTGDGGMGDSEEDEASLESKGPTFDDIKQITIRRSKLAKWFMEPFFEELIVGCYVRVGIGKSRTGPIYRLCMVRNVDASDPDRQYKLEAKTTHKYLNCVWGNETSAARWQMAMVSDSPPIEEEYNQLLREVERSNGRMPSKRELLEKKAAIQKASMFVYSAATVKQMLQEKKSTFSRPLNIAAEKDRLRRELAAAESKRNDAEMERIKARILQLEASRKTPGKDDKAVRLAAMNKKNRVENFKNASETKPVNIGLKAGEAGYDPFSRRWTRSRNYYVKRESGNEAAPAVVASEGEITDVPLPDPDNTETKTRAFPETGIAATAAALEAAAGAGKLVDTMAPVDRGTDSNLLHNFELSISLAGLQKYGGSQGAMAGFMARKQRIEATVGVQVPENDGRRHALTLTVGDYKRRRGLL